MSEPGVRASQDRCTAAPYGTSLEHVLAELERLDLLVRVQVWRARQRAADEDAWRGVYIAEHEPEELLDRVVGTPSWTAVPLPSDLLDSVQARLDVLSATIVARTAASLEARVPLRLVMLAVIFELSQFEVDVVLACLAPELDHRYERLYAYLHDDMSRRQPTIGLVLDLFGSDLEDKVVDRRSFSPTAPLIRHQLVLSDEALRLDPRLTRFLLGDDDLEDRLRRSVGLAAPGASIDDLIAPDPLRQQLLQIIEHAHIDGDDLVLYLQGPYGVGKQTAAAACASALGHDLLVVDGGWLASRSEEHFVEQVCLIDREARLQGALLYWKDFDALLDDDRRSHLAALLEMLEVHPGPTFLAGDVLWEPVDALAQVEFVRLELPQPEYAQRLALWRTLMGGNSVGLEEVASTFRLSGGQIRDAAATARSLARSRQPADVQVTSADLHAACRLQSNRKLAQLAQKITPHYTWDDIVLPADQLTQLRDIADQVRYRALVYDTWGFDAKLAMGKGINVLFSGPPGTGKTMAADVLAGTLGVDLYKIDLSVVVSKYIGETEKNLSRIFAEARTSNAILFFDEADALFGKRTQVRDAHDRYANVEISFLLQKMEEYEGLVILATNMRQNMDEAFVRRLHFMVELPLPDAADRRRIWEQIWPSATPRDVELDFGYLAERVEVAGGNIRNIALSSAFLAAADGGTVSMRHVVAAVRREYQKIGKVLTGTEFGARNERRDAAEL